MGPSISPDVTVADVIALNVHLLLETPPARERMQRRQLRTALGFLPVAAILIALVVVVRSTLQTAVALVSCAFLVAWVLLLPVVAARQVAKRIPQWIASGQFPPPTPSLLWIDDHGTIVNQSRDRTTMYALSSVEGVDETPDHIFIIVGVGQGLVIPRRIGEPAVRAFLQTLEWHRARTYAEVRGHPPRDPSAWPV